MLNLEKISGLPVQLTDDFQIQLGNNAQQTAFSTRTASEMKDVLMDPEAKIDQTDLYYMYRGICLKEHASKIEEEHLSYDITVLPALMLGKEYNKTLGHYHSYISGTELAYPELYEVLNGKGLFILQKMDHNFEKLSTVLAVEAQAGDKIIYPPNYGHIIVNIGSEPLVTANWVSTDNKSNYEPVKQKHGMALYVVKGDDGKPTFVKNKNYTDEPMMRKMVMTDKLRTDFGLEQGEPMYTTAMRDPKILEFLSNPAKYAVQLSALSS